MLVSETECWFQKLNASFLKTGKGNLGLLTLYLASYNYFGSYYLYLKVTLVSVILFGDAA